MGSVTAAKHQPHKEMGGTDKRPPLVSGNCVKQRLTDKPEDNFVSATQKLYAGLLRLAFLLSTSDSPLFRLRPLVGAIVPSGQWPKREAGCSLKLNGG